MPGTMYIAPIADIKGSFGRRGKERSATSV